MRSYKLALCLLLLCVSGFLQAQSLNDYLKIAAENNPGIKSKYADFEAAMQRVAQVNALPDPSFSFAYFISPVETRVGPQRARFGLSQMFPWFGTLAAKGEMAALMAEAKYKEFLNERNELNSKVKAAWYPLYEVNRVIQLQKENKEILFIYKQLSTTAFKNGKAGLVDVIRVDIMIENAETEIKILTLKKKPLQTNFNKLLNRADTAKIIFADSLFITAIPENYRMDSLLSGNPALQAIDLKIKSAEAQEKIAKKEGMPKFGVGIDYVIVGNRTDMSLKGNGKDVIMPMVSMSIPVFRGKYKAAIKEAQFNQAAFTYSKQQYENNLVSNYEATYFELDKAVKLMELYKVQVTKTNQVINLLLTAYRNSGKEFEELLRMQQDLLKYQIAESVSLKEYYTALARLDYLTAKTD